MKSRMTSLAGVTLLGVACTLHLPAQPAPTITYQGVLTEGGSPATGLYDLTFTLFDSGVGSFVQAGPITNAATFVSNGLFTVSIDFGIGFEGAAYWLEIGAVTNGGSPFTVLNPRQLLTWAPMALHAGSAATVDMGTVSDPVFLGTTTASPLELSVNNEPALRLEYDSDGLYPTINVIGGHGINSVGMGSGGSVVAGGGFALYPNSIGTNSEFGVIAGGVGNRVGDDTPYATVSGGAGNLLEDSVYGGVIGGGWDNHVGPGSPFAAILSGEGNNLLEASAHAAIVGGRSNSVLPHSELTVIAGGGFNQIGTQSWHSVVSGGFSNRIVNTRGSVIGGGEENVIDENSNRSTIGGGLYNTMQSAAVTVIGGGESNSVLAAYGTLSGGLHNEIGLNSWLGTLGGGRNNLISSDSPYATIGGGSDNVIGPASGGALIAGGYDNALGMDTDYSVLGGGRSNTIVNTSQYALVGGGYGNSVGLGADYASIGGGLDNRVGARADYAVIPGGLNNAVADDATYAFAAGRGAHADHIGALVWGDSQATSVHSSADDQVTLRARNGLRLTEDAGGGKAIQIGDRYKDNALLAWGKVSTAGNLLAGFGVSSVTSTNTGDYDIVLTDTASDIQTLIPMAIAEIDARPASASAARIVSINQDPVTPDRFKVYVNNGNYTPVNNEFVFMVTAR